MPKCITILIRGALLNLWEFKRSCNSPLSDGLLIGCYSCFNPMPQISDLFWPHCTYWSILKTFCNGKKIPVIPPILINSKFVSNFEEKANHFSGKK